MEVQIQSDTQAITVRKSLRLAQLLRPVRIKLRAYKSKEASKTAQQLQKAKEMEQLNNTGQ